MMRLLLALLVCPALATYGQGRKIKSLDVSDTIMFTAIDRPGDLYVLTKSGQIQRFDKDGALQQLFRQTPAPTLFDPRDGSRLFAFFRQQRQYTFYNPSFEPTESYRIDSAFALEPWLVCASGDHNVWVLDAADWSVKKIDTKKGEVMVETTLENVSKKSKTDFIFLREYQGFLFVHDRGEGIHIYNSMGRFIRTLPAPGIAAFNFLGEEVYYLHQGKLRFFDLFTAETRDMTLPASGKFVLLSDERMFVTSGTSTHIFSFKP